MDLSKHLDKAKEAIQRRNHAMAVQICSQLLAIQPDDGDVRQCLREALFKKAQQKAPAKIAAVLGGGAHVIAMHVWRLLGKHAAAARAAERYLVFDPFQESVNLALGDSLERAGHKRSALAVFRAFALERPRCLTASRRAGALLYAAGLLPDALAMYEQALKVDPRDQEALKARKNLAAEGALQSTRLEHAQSSRELIKDIEAQKRLEREHRMQLDPDEVAKELGELEAALVAHPDDVTALVRSSELRLMADDAQGALGDLERAIRAAPERLELRDRAGDLQLRLQEQRVAAAQAAADGAAAERARAVLLEMRTAEYRRRLAQHPTDLGIRFQLGCAMLDAGDVDAAIAELQLAVKDPRRKSEARLQLARAFRRKGLGDLALSQLEKALADAGDFGRAPREILYEMGCVAEDLGRPADALRLFSRVLEQDIGYRDVANKVQQLKTTIPT